MKWDIQDFSEWKIHLVNIAMNDWHVSVLFKQVGRGIFHVTRKLTSWENIGHTITWADIVHLRTHNELNGYSVLTEYLRQYQTLESTRTKQYFSKIWKSV